MFTVTVFLVGSGNSSTLSPFSSRYSVMPSTVVTRCTPFGSCVVCPSAKLMVRRQTAADCRNFIDFSEPQYIKNRFGMVVTVQDITVQDEKVLVFDVVHVKWRASTWYGWKPSK